MDHRWNTSDPTYCVICRSAAHVTKSEDVWTCHNHHWKDGEDMDVLPLLPRKRRWKTVRYRYEKQ